MFKYKAHKLIKKWDDESKEDSNPISIGGDLGSIASETIAKVAMGVDYDF